jgi:hypothetical protein
MTDATADDSPYFKELDVVGDAASAAAYHASDATYLYLRVRWDEDPAPTGVLKASAWGIAFDLDNDPTTYEVLVMVDGTGPTAQIEVYTNHATTVADSPLDPADQPVVATFPFAANARTVVAAGSTFGATPDYFLDFAVPWSTLVPLGLDHATSVRVWAGSSTVNDLLNGDLACVDERNGPATLQGASSSPAPADPGAGGGGDAAVGGSQLVGGERCEVGAGGSLGILAVLGLVCRRRRRAPS